MNDAPQLRHFVAGEFVEAAGSDRLASLDPASRGDVVAYAPAGAPANAEAALAAAASAFPTWSALAASERANFLAAWAEAIAARADEFARLVCREVGKPIAEARGEVARGTALLRYYAGEAVRPAGEVIPAARPQSLQYARRQACGPAVLITPWNFPIAIPLWKAAPALAFGNTVVLKPSELSAACGDLLAQTALAAGLPPGVFNLVHGSGATLGPALLAHPEVRLASFTGSERVGMSVAETCARRNLKYQTEMGGKNAAIVLADAELDRAARLVAGGAMRFAGQKCTATSRAIVVREAMDEFAARLAREIEALPLGPPSDPAAAVGPVISEAARERILAELSAAEGETVLGGTAPLAAPFDAGSYVRPTVIRGVSAGSRFAQEELFGPALGLIEARDLDEAIELANGVRFGLSAAIFTRDLADAMRYVHRIEAGMVRVNGDTTGVDLHAPFGGLKASGSHSREQGQAAREFYTELKTVELNP